MQNVDIFNTFFYDFKLAYLKTNKKYQTINFQFTHYRRFVRRLFLFLR